MALPSLALSARIASDLHDRRAFLADTGMGLTGIALGSLLAGQSRASETAGHRPPDGRPHFAPKAKSVIWLFMAGGVSQVESWDPKPALDRFAGTKISESPFAADARRADYLRSLRRGDGMHFNDGELYPMQVGFRRRGQSGIEICDWQPHLAECVDDLAVVRSFYTNHNNHGAQLTFHTGRHVDEGPHPTIGSWVHYGLGALNENLPQFVVLGDTIGDCCGGPAAHGAHYLGPVHNGVYFDSTGIPYLRPRTSAYEQEQRGEFELLGDLHRQAGVRYPDDPGLQARIRSFELAARMQSSIPELFDLRTESAATLRLYGAEGSPFARQCLMARRLVERGVRFVQIFHGGGGAGVWDAHSSMRANHAANFAATDRPVAALLKDLKRTGLLDETIVVWGTEFGRTPGRQGGNGRDHHSFGFTCWLAGAGLKKGVVHGATDELGFHAVEHRHYITDLHATVLHLLGLDPRQLDVPGRRRLDIDHGRPIREILA